MLSSVSSVLNVVRRFGNGKNWLENKQTSILSAAAVITGSVILSSLTGLLSYRLLASTFYDPTTRSQPQLDAYWVAFQPSDIVFQLLVVGALSAAFIPVFTKYKQKDEQDAFRLASSVMNSILLVFGLVAIVVFIFAPYIVRAMTGDNFSDDQVILAANMTRIMLFAQFFFAISNFLSGMIQSYQRFIIPALSPVAYNLGIIIGTVFLSPIFGIFGPVYGVLLGAFAHMAMQIPLAYKLGFRYYALIDWKHEGLHDVLTLSLPRALSVGIDLIQPYFLTFFITSMAGVNLTLMRFAQRLMTIPIRMFGVPISQAALPFLSQETSSNNDYVRYNQLLLQSIHQVAFFSMPASVLLLILRIPIVRFAFGAKNFPWGDTVLTGKIVAILAISVSAQAITHILIRGFYAIHDTRRPFIVSIFSMIIGVFLGWYITYFTPFLSTSKILGLAGTITVTGFLETIILFVLLHRRTNFSLQQALIPLSKMAVSSILMALGLYFPLKLLDIVIIDTTKTLGLLVLTGVVGVIGMTVYILIAKLLHVEELYIVKKLFGKMGLWKENLSKSGEAIETVGAATEQIDG